MIAFAKAIHSPLHSPNDRQYCLPLGLCKETVKQSTLRCQTWVQHWDIKGFLQDFESCPCCLIPRGCGAGYHGNPRTTARCWRWGIVVMTMKLLDLPPGGIARHGIITCKCWCCGEPFNLRGQVRFLTSLPALWIVDNNLYYISSSKHICILPLTSAREKLDRYVKSFNNIS